MITNAKKFIQEEILGEKRTLGKTIWAFRKSEEILQSDLAKQLGISKQYLCDIENNRRNLSPKQAAHFARLMKMPEKYFVHLAL